MSLNEDNKKAITTGTNARVKIKEEIPKNFLHSLYAVCLILGIFWLIFKLFGDNQNKVVESFFDTIDFDWTTFPPREWLNTYFSADLTNYIMWAVVILAVLWVIGTAWRKLVSKQTPVVTFGIAGTALVTIIAIVAITIAIKMAFFSDDKKKFVYDDRPIPITIKTLDTPHTIEMFHDGMLKISVNIPKPADGKSTHAVCAEIIEPNWLLTKESVPTEHIKYLRGAIGNRLVLTDDMREFLTREKAPLLITVQLVAKRVNYFTAAAGTTNHCPHSTY